MAVGLRFSAGIAGLSSLAASAAAGWPCWSWLGAGLSHLGTEELWLWVGQLVSSQSPHLETTSPTPSLAAFPQLEVDPYTLQRLHIIPLAVLTLAEHRVYPQLLLQEGHTIWVKVGLCLQHIQN